MIIVIVYEEELVRFICHGGSKIRTNAFAAIISLQRVKFQNTRSDHRSLSEEEICNRRCVAVPVIIFDKCKEMKRKKRRRSVRNAERPVGSDASVSAISPLLN